MVTFFGVLFPITIVFSILALPYKILFQKNNTHTETEINVEVTGPAKGTEPKDDLLFMHGWPDSGELWDAQVKELSKDYRCIVITLPGFGKASETPSSWGF